MRRTAIGGGLATIALACTTLPGARAGSLVVAVATPTASASPTSRVTLVPAKFPVTVPTPLRFATISPYLKTGVGTIATFVPRPLPTPTATPTARPTSAPTPTDSPTPKPQPTESPTPSGTAKPPRP